jgi:DNA-binding NarL/FixJ family response regulator
MGSIRVVLADDHGLLRKGVRSVLSQDHDIAIVGEAGDGSEAVRLVEQLSPDVVVMDVAMPGLNGIDAAAQMTRRSKQLGVIMLTMYPDEEYLIRAVTAGVRGYLLKDSAEPDLIRAIKEVSAGHTFFSAAVANTLIEDYVARLQRSGARDSYDLLTEREKQVLQLLAEGKTNKDVATILALGLSTVESHRLNLMKKLGLHNTAELVLYAVRMKILRV